MRRREAGFSLIELLITMTVFVLVIAASSQIFTSLLTQFKQQSKISETNIEGIIGLEILRRDIEHAGYGLPWVIPSTVVYSEAVVGYNDCTGVSPCDAPRAILSGNDAGFNGSDELIIKAANVARNVTAQTWTHLQTGDVKRNGLSGENFANDDLIIVLSPGTSEANTRTLVTDSTDTTPPYNWDTTYNATSNFDPSDNTETRFIYGIAPTTITVTNLRMPFNRADYYISTSNVPQRCAPNTGIFSKNVISHADGSRADNLPLLDCVADMQVVYSLDTDGNGTIDTSSNNISALNAQQIREQVKEVTLYIFAHEGQIDRNYTFNNFTGIETCATCVRVGESASLGRDFNLSTITDFLNYRWKLYTLVVKPNNLR